MPGKMNLRMNMVRVDVWHWRDPIFQFHRSVKTVPNFYEGFLKLLRLKEIRLLSWVEELNKFLKP